MSFLGGESIVYKTRVQVLPSRDWLIIWLKALCFARHNGDTAGLHQMFVSSNLVLKITKLK